MREGRLSRREFVRLGANAAAFGMADQVAFPRSSDRVTNSSSGRELTENEAPLMSRAQSRDQALRPYPGGSKADIWVFSGQSNSQGWALLKAPLEPDPRVMFFDESNQWVVAQEPLNKEFYRWTPPPVEQNILLQRDSVQLPRGMTPETFLQRQTLKGEGPLGGVGPSLFFAKHLRKYLDRPIGLMSCGRGSWMKQWDPSLKSQGMASLYGAMIERIAMVGGEIRGIIWYQGESDALTAGAEEAYEEAFLHLIDSLRKDIGIADLPFIYVQVGRFVHPYDSRVYGWERIRDIQRRVASQRKNLYMVSAIDLMLEDAIHIGFEGYQRLGPRLAEIALAEVYRQPGHATPISLETIEVLALDSRRPMIRVRFKGVNGRLIASGRPTGFELRAARPSEDPTRSYPQPPTVDVPMHVIYRVDFDPNDPATVILGVFDNSPILLGKPHSLSEPVSLVYGGGMNPYVNIVDEKDIPIPAFGPIEVRLRQ
jgi:hypothetical protein